MIKHRDTLTIMLTPEHLSMASVRSGKVVQAERVALDPDRWDESWGGGLHLYDQPLRQLLARFGGSGKARWANLHYISPGSVCRVDITNSDAVTSVAKMHNGLKQSVGRANPTDAVALNSCAESTLVLGVGDEEANLQKIYAWLNRSRIVAECMIPMEACVVHEALIDALSVDPGTAILYISERSNVIGYCEDGIPKLVRLIEIGYDKLEAVYRQALSNDEEQPQAHQSHASSGKGSDRKKQASTEPDRNPETDWTTMLFREGIPVSAGKGMESKLYGTVMPAMAPILQRISIEVKQTFRFASSLNSPPSKLLICGPGAAIPMIGAALSQNLDLHVDINPAAKTYKPTTLFGEGTLENAAAHLNLDLELLPRAAKELRVRSGLNHAIKLGVLGAASLIGGQYLYATQQSDTIAAVLAQQSNVIDRIQQDQERRVSVAVMAGAIGSAAALLEDTMGERVQWTGFLGSIPNEDHPLVRVSELQGRMNGQHPMINLTGVAVGVTDGQDASEVLSEYIKALKEMPEVERIEIGSTTRTLMDDSSWGLQFVLAIEIGSVDGRFSEYLVLGQGGQGDHP